MTRNKHDSIQIYNILLYTDSKKHDSIRVRMQGKFLRARIQMVSKMWKYVEINFYSIEDLAITKLPTTLNYNCSP